MEEDVTKTVIKTLRAYLSDELPLDQDFIRKLDHRDLLASDKAAMLVALADKGDRSCIHQLITYMEQFYTEEMLLRLCDFLEEYAHQARPRLATIASRIRQEISKHKPKITSPVPEDTLHRSAGAHDEPLEMDTGGDGDAPSRPPGAGTKRGHQTAKEDAPIAKNPKPTDFKDLASGPSAVDLRNISRETGRIWKDLLRYLKIKEPKIEELVSNNPNDIAEACFQGLMFWENENALLPVTWSTLLEALKKAELTKLANQLPLKKNKPQLATPVPEVTLRRSARVHDEGAGDRDAPVDNRPDNTQQTVGVPPSRRCPPAAKGMSSLDPSGSRTFTPGPAQGSDESERMGSGVQDTKSPSDSTFSDQFKALDEHPVKIHLLAQFICDMAPQWLPIATQLGPKVSEKAHSDIDKRQCFDNEKMTRVLNSWIDSGENVCWSNILSAIHKVDLHSALAQEMLKLLPDLLTSQAKPSVDAERYDGIPISLPLVADFVQRMCVEWYRIAFYFGGRTAIEAHGQIDLDPSPASTKMSKVIEVWIDSVDGDVRWSVLNDALRTVGLGGVANSIEQRLDEQLSPLDSDDLHLPDDSSPPSPPPPPLPTWTEQYEKAIEQRGSVTLDITRCVLIGPPRVGKSSLKLFLINNEPPFEDVKKSTDLMEAPVVLTSIQYQKKKGFQWKELAPNELQQLVSKCTRKEEYNPAQLNPIQPSDSLRISMAVAAHTDNVSTTVTESSSTSMHLVDSELAVRLPDIVETAMSEESLAELKMNVFVQPFAIPNPKQSTEIVDLLAEYKFFCKEVMPKESLTELEMNGLKMVHVFDCGGQLAFQDTIPLLINAPCAFISVFNASIDLDEEVELKYCPENGVELSLGHKESQWNMLRRIFSSIHSLQFKCHDDISKLLKDKTVVPSSPIAVVGTHKDVLQEDSENDRGLRQRNTEKKIKDRLEQLRESKLYDFLRKGSRTLDLVANLSRDDLSAIEFLRRDIVKSKATLSLELPLSWIILELFTRNRANKFFPYHDLQELCIHDNIVRDKEEFSSLLQVLHVLGFYAFYQLDGVPEDQNWVCTDAATLYREVTKILVVQRCKEPENLKEITTTLQQYGRIPLKEATLKDLFTDLQINIGKAKPMWFIRVLLHIGLAVKIEDEVEEAFIPLALPFKHSDLPPVTSVATICFTLEFPSGTRKSRVRANVTEIPRGIFPRLIVYLLSQQRSGEFQWLVDKGDSRSRIKLRHQSEKYVIYLSEHVDHIELDLVLNDTFLPTLDNVKCTTEVGHLCQGLREHFISALRNTFVSVFGEQLPERKPSVVCGFICSSCRDSSCHMAIVQPAKGATAQLYTEKCVHKRFPRIVEKPDQLIWFSPEKETAFEKETIEDQDGQWTIWVMKGTGVLKSDLANRPSAKDLRDISHKTGKDSKDLLRSLEIEDARIATFVMDNPNDIAEACYQGLLLWENENALLPVTWGTLKAALKKAKLTKLANMLPPKEK